MVTIHLNNVKMYAYHGWYEEEKIKGNEFELTIIIHYLPKVATITQLSDTINYAEVYQLLQARMAIATPLLETVAMDVANQILDTFALAQHTFVSITKLNPPIPDFSGSVSVSFELGRD